jgi:protein-S-isoprenylcysteine O-methyltransferase Ste14
MASKTTQITLITLQFGILLLQTGSVALQLRSAVPGLLVALLWLACMALGLWALSANRPGNFNIRPEPKADGQLVQTGPYRWIRHPMYTAVLWLKAVLEERMMCQRHPAYRAYMARTRRFLPFLV